MSSAPRLPQPSPIVRALGAVIASATLGGCAGAAPSPPPTTSASSAGARATEHVPCAAAGPLLASLDSPVVADLYVTAASAEAVTERARVERLLGAFRTLSPGKLTFGVHELRTEQDVATAKAALPRSSLADRAGGAAPAFLVLHQGSRQEVIPNTLSERDTWGLELLLLLKLRDLRDAARDHQRRIGLLVGHGEIGLSTPDLLPTLTEEERREGPNLQRYITESFPMYRFVDVDLRGGATPVDETLAGLLVTQPATDLSDAELRALDRYAMTGKALTIVASNASIAVGDPTLSVTFGAHGLERLMAGYGVEVNRDVVLDREAPFEVKVTTPGGPLTFRATQLVHLTPDLVPAGEWAGFDATAMPFFGLDELMFPYASSLTLHRERQPRATYAVIAHSSARARSETRNGSARGLAIPIPTALAERRADLAVLVGGGLDSAFSSPGRTASARLLLVSSSQLFANPYALALLPSAGPAPTAGDQRALQSLGNAYGRQNVAPSFRALEDILDWMTEDGGLIQCVPATRASL